MPKTLQEWEAYFAPLAEEGARQREIEERERNRVLTSDEIEARVGACEKCKHNRGHDHLRVHCDAPCKTCRKRKDGVVHRAITLAREKCPMALWVGSPMPSPVGDVPWEYLWALHKGKTFLVVGRGPSAMEHLDRFAEIERDVTIGCNYAIWLPEEQAAILPDYALSVDENPCQLPTPNGVKLISGANTDDGKRARIGKCWCVYPYHVAGNGEIARGVKLPTSQNSGIAAISLAIYMGASSVKVVGVDYNQTAAGAMHTNDTDPERKRKYLDQFSKTFARVQRGLRHAIRNCRIHGVALECLAAKTRLDWSREDDVVATFDGATKDDEKRIQIALWHAGFTDATLGWRAGKLIATLLRREGI